jgi:transposase-like protein
MSSPADIVISRFGGVRPLARLLGKDPSTIHRWRQPAERGGLDGRVPSAAQVRLLDLARERGIELSPADLVLGSCASAGGESSPAPAEVAP